MYVYIMHGRGFKYKIGKSKNPRRRLEQVDESMRRVRVTMVFTLDLLFADQWERFLHFVYAPLRTPYLERHYSGRSEWFMFILPITPILFLLLFWLFEKVYVFARLAFWAALIGGIIWLIFRMMEK